MAKRLSMTDIFDTVTVEVDGTDYTLRDTTKSMIARINDIQERQKRLPEDLADDAPEHAEFVFEMIDALLQAPKGAEPAGLVLKAKYEQDEIGFGFLMALSSTLLRETQERANPTSALTTSG